MSASSPSPMVVAVNERLRNKRLDDYITLWHRNEFLYDGSTINTSIFKLAPTSYWLGPMIAVVQVGDEDLYKNQRDMTAADLRHLVDHFAGYASRIGMGADTVGKPDVKAPGLELLGGHELQDHYPESTAAKAARFYETMHTEGLEAAVKGMPREKGYEKSFATVWKMVEEDRKAKEEAKKA